MLSFRVTCNIAILLRGGRQGFDDQKALRLVERIDELHQVLVLALETRGDGHHIERVGSVNGFDTDDRILGNHLGLGGRFD